MTGKSFSICLMALGIISGSADSIAAPKQLLRQVSVPGHPFAAAPSPNGRWIFVSVTGSSAAEKSGVAVLGWDNSGQISLKRLIPLNPAPKEPVSPGLTAPAGMVVTHDGKLLIAAHDKFVAFLDVQKAIGSQENPVLGFMRIGEDAFNVYANATRDGKYLFISDEGPSGAIVVIDLERARHNSFPQDAIVGRIPTGRLPVGLVFSPDEKLLYATNAIAATEWEWPLKCQSEVGATATPEGAIMVIDVEKAKRDPKTAVLGRVPGGCMPVRLDITPDGSSIWTTVRKDDAVAGYDAAKLLMDPEHARIAWVPVGHAPVGIAITRDGKYILNTNSGRFRADANSPQTTTIIDRASAIIGSAAIVGSVETGVFPRQISLSPDGKMIFITNYLSKTLTVLGVEDLLGH